MKERINDKIEEIENYLSRLIDMAPETFEAYKTNGEKKWSCERGLEMISEASIDLAFLIIKYKKLENAIDDIGAFEILKENNIILPELCEKLQDLKKMSTYSFIWTDR
ncbi:DUF86 domain-containing protein [Candidatus Pacearchaeota archaeon]|nr:DUF86 domain-containing protein [Candidatus Pacearchaeota archaeon]